MSVTPNYVPREFKTLNIILRVKDAHKALAFYNSAFGAEAIQLLESPDKVVIHLEMKIDDTIVMLTESPEEINKSGVVLQLYTGDVFAVYESAIKAGCAEVSPISKQFNGDNSGRVKDPFGYEWILSTHVEDVSSREVKRRFNELYP